MKNALLIYNDNIAPQLVIDFAEKLGSTYKFQLGNQELLNPNFTMDGKIDAILKSSIINSEYSCIFIPFSLSENNYVEFLGLRFACHIRLTAEFHNLNTPIVFYGYETTFEINKLSTPGSILFSKGIYTTDKISIQDFEAQIAFILENPIQIEPQTFTKLFLERLHVKPAGNYATHHSIANEWAIYRWAKALQLETENIQRIESSIGSNLYYKYLKCKYPITEVVDANRRIILERGRILYIDDEVNKGWDAIFRQICSNITYNSIGSDFKEMTSCTIIDSASQKVQEFNPDVVILDYRLHDDDFENTNPQEITGYKILKGIKEINEGIQVIILSATNKIWNLMELQKAGADGFILKESPELSIDRDFSKNTFTNTYRTINEALAKKYLKTIYTAWKESIQTTRNSDEKFISESNVTLKTAWQLINSEHLDMGYLTIYQNIENYASKLYQTGDDQDSIDETTVIDKSGENKNIWKLKYIKDERNGDYFNFNNQEQPKTQRPTTLFKVSCLFHFKFKYNNNQLKEIGKLNKIRNNIAHGVRIPRSQIQHSTKDDFVKLLGLIMTIRNT